MNDLGVRTIVVEGNNHLIIVLRWIARFWSHKSIRMLLEARVVDPGSNDQDPVLAGKPNPDITL